MAAGSEEETEKEEKGYHRVERSFGRFERTVPLPSEVQTGKVEASYKKGVLTITLPKTAEAKSERKKIAIKST